MQDYKMAFVEIPLNKYVTLSNFGELPQDLRELLMMLSKSGSESRYVIRISSERMEIGYQEDDWYYRR